jgi:hypothetical protein
MWKINPVMLALLALSGCATTAAHTPNPTQAKQVLRGLPASAVAVEINDLRPDIDASDATRQVLRSEVVSALSPEPLADESVRFTLNIDIIEHRSFFTPGYWNASARLRARLTDSAGGVRGQWESTGSGRRSNMLGYAAAKAVSQDSYNMAVADLFSLLTSMSVR